MSRKLLSNFFQQYIASRNIHRIKRYINKKEGIAYPGFRYYPRVENEKDPDYKPTKLFMVKRIKTLKGQPYWEKNIMKDLKLLGNDIAIIKNIPENNARLWRVKHLIKVTPIQFPNGEPTEDDINATYLRENGDFLVSKKLEIPADRLEAFDKFVSDPKKFDGDTLRRYLRLKWLTAW